MFRPYYSIVYVYHTYYKRKIIFFDTQEAWAGYRLYLYVMCLPNFGPEGGDASGVDAVIQKIQLRDGEHALLLVEDQPVGGEDSEQRAEGRSVLLSGFAEDSVII